MYCVFEDISYNSDIFHVSAFVNDANDFVSDKDVLINV